MIGQGLGRLALAEKLSIGQLQEAIQNKSIPAYIGIPLLEEKMMFEQRMRSAGQGIAPQMDQPPIAEEVMAQATQMDGGIDQLPVPEAELAGGGIVAFEDGGQVQRFQNQGLVEDAMFGMGAGQMSMPRKELVDLMTLPELQEYNRSGKVPERLRGAVGERPVEGGSFLGGIPLTRQPAQFAVPPTPTPTAPAPTAAPAPAPTVDKEKADQAAGAGRRDLPSGAGMTPEEFRRQQAAFGITGDVDADLKKQIEDLAKGTKAERQQAKYMALLQAGLGIMGGTSPRALENISAGAQRGLTQYAGDVKDIKAQERDLMKLRGELARAEDARKRGDFKAFMDAQDKAKKLELDLYQAQSGRMVAEAQQTRAKTAGSGINPYQLASLRMRAEQEVDPAAIRSAVAKEKKLSKVPPPGVKKDFDEAVAAAYQAEIDKRINRALGIGGGGGGGGGGRGQFRIIPDEE